MIIIKNIQGNITYVIYSVVNTKYDSSQIFILDIMYHMYLATFGSNNSTYL